MLRAAAALPASHLVAEVLHDADLALHALGLVRVRQLGLVDHLDRHLALTQVVHRQAHLHTRTHSATHVGTQPHEGQADGSA